ncbi:MAG: ABC transporter ATP-binding protein [Bacteroidaceae bacterium]|nr:ABC transporter ATP-binding protein [Bacteroidaceae bacterium]
MIQISNLNYSYLVTKKVLSNINLEIKEGHVYGLLGKNGVGKSTFLKLVCGILNPKLEISATQAPVLVDGIDSHGRPTEMLKLIRFVGENEAVPELTIGQWASIVAPFYDNFSMDILDKALSAFEVPQNQKLTQMSHGQQKKSIISLALACNTKYLFMDEPTNGMDIPSKSTFRQIIAECMTEDKTIIISTHQVDDIEKILDAVIILDNTAVLLNDTIEEIGKKYAFGKAEEGDEILYTEPSILGNISVIKNKTGIESPVDLKLLFTAIVKGNHQNP